jgi:hypothetical protein
MNEGPKPGCTKPATTILWRMSETLMRESAKTLMYVFVGTQSFEGVRRQEGADLQSGQVGQVKDSLCSSITTPFRRKWEWALG